MDDEKPIGSWAANGWAGQTPERIREAMKKAADVDNRIVTVIALREDRAGDDGCRLQVGDNITLAHAFLHPEAITSPI